MTRLRLALIAWLLLVALPIVAPPVAAQPANTASITPATGPIGTRVSIGGAGWPANRAVTVTFGQNDYSEWAKGSVNADGSLSLMAIVPRRFSGVAGTATLVTPGQYTINIVTAPGPDRSTMVAAVRFTVVAATLARPAIAWRFAEYYYQHDGGRLLGGPLTDARFEAGRRIQYFEKGRIEDHASVPGATGPWRFLYGRLGAELAADGGALPVGGDTSSVTYATLKELARPDRRLPPPPSWGSSVAPDPDEPVFVPFDADLRRADGHYVPARFWDFINRSALFPAGWLHDIGLPMTEAIEATVTKTIAGERVERTIRLQLFERTLLTDDPANPDGFQIERANLGSDYLKTDRGLVIPGDVVLHPAFRWLDPRPIDANLPEGLRAPAWEWRSEVSAPMVTDAEIAWLRQQLDLEGWQITAQTGNGASGTLEAVKGRRLQFISWGRDAGPATSPDASELTPRIRVLAGEQA